MAQAPKNPFSPKDLPVLVTVDVCDGSFDQEERKGRFRDLMELLPGIRDLLGEVVVSWWGERLPVTWFVRADTQVKEVTGNAMGLYHGWKDFWRGIRSSGGEVAWHPHLYKRHGQRWTPIRDPQKLRTEAEKIRHEISGEEWKPLTCRMGESVGSNELMALLDSIGMLADSSALPGRVRDDGQRWFNWENTPRIPYHPAKGDYRRPSAALGSGDRAKEEESLSILEIPFTMAEIRAPYDSGKVRRYVDLSYDPESLRKGMASLYKTAEYLVLVVHPLQAAGREVPPGGLVVGGWATVRQNLKAILEDIESANRNVHFVTMERFARRWTGKPEETPGDRPPEAAPAEREERDVKKAGGTQRTLVEKDKSVRMTSPGGIKPSKRPPRRDPRKRKG